MNRWLVAVWEMVAESVAYDVGPVALRSSEGMLLIPCTGLTTFPVAQQCPKSFVWAMLMRISHGCMQIRHLLTTSIALCRSHM